MSLQTSMGVLIFATLVASCTHSSSPLVQPIAPHTLEPLTVEKQLSAEVDGKLITIKELEKRLSESVLGEEITGLDDMAIYIAKHSILETMIAEVLLEQEAQRRGITPQELRESIINGLSVSDEEVDISYKMAIRYHQTAKRYKGKGGDPILIRRVNRLLAGSEPEARQRVREYFLQEKIRTAILTFTRPLKEQADITVYLKKPNSHENGKGR